ncbi:MAG: hypothetical protein R3324_08245 [Halobacteriales archaeon]|nr:hypothetical protein [Halobacteriales archaeon]
MSTESSSGLGVGPFNPDVMASIDSNGHDETLVIADISTDDAWVSISTGAAAPLTEWR